MSQVWCYIDDCRNEATQILHSYPDDVRLCDRHKRPLSQLDLLETVCVGARCPICEVNA